VNTCLDGTVNGQCIVSFVSNQPGPISVDANVSVEILPNLVLERSTDGEIGNSLNAVKTFVDASISLEPSGSIEIEDEYPVTATVKKALGDGKGFIPADGAQVAFTLTDANDTNNPPTILATGNCTTGSDGTCSYSFTSAEAKTIRVHGSVDHGVLGLSLHRETDGISPNSGDVLVNFVDGNVDIQQDATLEAGIQHTFTVIVSESGGGTVIGFTPTFTLTTGLQIDENLTTCISSVPVMGDSCLLVVNSEDPGTYTVNLTADYTTSTGVPISRSNSATVTYVAARVSVVPSSAENGVDENHTFTVTVETHDGTETGWVPLEGLVAGEDFTLDFGANMPDTLDNGCEFDPVTQTGGTNSSGVCVVTISNASAGDFTLIVAVDTELVVGALSVPVHASATGTKSYKEGSLTWSKVDQNGAVLGGATFEACRVKDRHGTDIPAECQAVTDTPEVPGAFNLIRLRLGTWTVKETAAPSGYFADGRIDTVHLGTDTDNNGLLENLDVVIQNPWINIAFPGRILETGTTCEDYVFGSPIDLTEVIYNAKKGAINNVAPGVFFYYTTFAAPSASFSVELAQVNDGPAGFPNFDVQNESNIRLFNSDCSSPTASMTILSLGSQAFVSIDVANPGDVFVLSTKYETGAVVGLPEPGTVHYDYSTLVDGLMVDRDLDGVDLKKKGTK
jgi:hypothetical protein